MLWFPFVWISLGVARGAILALSFKRLSRVLGRSTDRFDFVPPINSAQARRVDQIRRVIKTASNNTPWVSNCFPQAIVARLLLGIYLVPYSLYFGLRRDADTGVLLAHAWVMSGDGWVCGMLKGETFQPVGCYGCQTWKGG
jgi:hypothetical protein